MLKRDFFSRKFKQLGNKARLSLFSHFRHVFFYFELDQNRTITTLPFTAPLGQFANLNNHRFALVKRSRTKRIVISKNAMKDSALLPPFQELIYNSI